MDNYREQTTLSRVLTLDAMRGGAALLVVMYHALGVAPRTAPAGWEWWLPEITGYIVHFAYAGIYLFFVISGILYPLVLGSSTRGGYSSTSSQLLLLLETASQAIVPSVHCRARAVSVLPRVQNSRSRHRLLLVGRSTSRLHVAQRGPSNHLHNQRRFLDARDRRTTVPCLFSPALPAHSLRLDQDAGDNCFSARIVWLIIARYLSYSFGIDIPVGEAAATNWFIWALGALSVEAALGCDKASCVV